MSYVSKKKEKAHLMPKRRETRRLGSFLPSMASTSSNLLNWNIIYKKKKELVSKNHREKRKYSPDAQTTCLTSFGAVFVIAGLYVVSLVIRT
jgi:hypothetical protein